MSGGEGGHKGCPAMEEGTVQGNICATSVVLERHVSAGSLFVDGRAASIVATLGGTTHARTSTFTLLEPLQGSLDFFIECS